MEKTLQEYAGSSTETIDISPEEGEEGRDHDDTSEESDLLAISEGTN